MAESSVSTRISYNQDPLSVDDVPLLPLEQELGRRAVADGVLWNRPRQPCVGFTIPVFFTPVHTASEERGICCDGVTIRWDDGLTAIRYLSELDTTERA
jgi:hypothetical protein